MDISIFTNRTQHPTNQDLVNALGETYSIWESLRDFIFHQYPKGVEEWNYPGTNYGWSFRIKDKRRAIAYFLPREGFFKMAFIFGGKAMEKIVKSEVSPKIIADLKRAKAYPEGRGIRIEVKDESPVEDIKKLILIKLGR
ncbi:MAG TPA: DUF3788 domain-containing protein [Sunxiuqinia sp.]|nr:DUF3788 domain-containing protein [Sunxiuqinia sp.]